MAEYATGQIFDDSKKRMQLTQKIPEGLNKMFTDFGEYYRYLQGIKQEGIQDDNNTQRPWTHHRGIVIQRRDSRPDSRGEAYNETPQRVSDIHPFSERNEIYMNYDPIRIVSYDGVSQEGIEIPCAFTLYIYENPAEREGYLGIVEPYEGNKTTRVFFKTKDEIDSLIKKGKEKGKGEVEVFENLGEEYICMSSQEFDSANRTTTLRHRGELNDFRIRVGSIVGKEKAETSGKRAYYKSIQQKLGILDCRKIVSEVTSERLNNARNAIELGRDKPKEGRNYNE